MPIESAPGAVSGCCLSYREQRYVALRQIIPDIRVRLYKNVEPELLRAAVKEALRLHPLFKTKLMRKDGLYYLIENDRIPVIREETWDRPPVFGTDGYLWSFTYSENLILLTLSHALTDASGAMAFLKTVLTLYLIKTGELAAETLSESASGGVLTNPYELFLEEPYSPPGVPRFPEPSDIPEEKRNTGAGITAYKVIFDKNEIKHASKDSETSMFSVLACMLARSVEKTFRMTDGSIEIRVPSDLRHLFHVETERNFVYGFSLHYDVGRMKHLSDAGVETAFRSQMDLFIDRDNLLHKMHREKQHMDELALHPEALDKLSPETGLSPRMPAKIMYSHMTKPGFPPEIEERAAKVEYVVHGETDNYLLFMAITWKDKIEMSVHSLMSDQLAEALRTEAENRGFFCKIERERTRPTPVFRPEGI